MTRKAEEGIIEEKWKRKEEKDKNEKEDRIRIRRA
jgi:hypothetical protein